MTQSETRTLSDENHFKDELMHNVPELRAFARLLCGRDDQALELAREAVGQAWDQRAALDAGPNLKTQLHKLLRGNYYARRGSEWNGATGTSDHDNFISVEDLPNDPDFGELSSALSALSDEQREALILVAVSGFAYKDAASICDCAVGTIKSRVARARIVLYQMLGDLNGSEIRDDAENGSASEVHGMQTPDSGLPPAQVSNAALGARRLMGASRRLMH